MIHSIDKNAKASDKEAFIAAYMDIWNHPDNLPFLSSTGIPFSREQIVTWLESTDRDTAEQYHVYQEDGSVLGIVVAKYDVLNGAEIMGVGVLPDAKGRSIGTRLVEHAMATASSRGFKAISTSAFADNARMQRLLVGRRFRPVSIEHGKRHDGMDLVSYRNFDL